MHEYQKPLADAIKKARGQLNITQEQAADLSGTETSNIAKMESVNRHANPTLDKLYPLVRALYINPNDIFYPELKSNNPRIQLLQQLLADCSDEEADALIPIIRELKQFMRNSRKSDIPE